MSGSQRLTRLSTVSSLRKQSRRTYELVDVYRISFTLSILKRKCQIPNLGWPDGSNRALIDVFSIVRKTKGKANTVRSIVENNNGLVTSWSPRLSVSPKKL